MAVNRLLYSSQTCLITVGGALKKVGGVFQYEENDDTSIDTFKGGPASDTPQWSTNGFTYTKDFLLAVQSASVDETIPQDDVLVFGNKAGVGRLQKDVASSKCTVKAYLPEYMKWNDGVDGSSNPLYRDAGKLNWTDAGGVWDGFSRQTGYNPASGSNSDQAANPDVDSSATKQVSETVQAWDWTKMGPFPGITDVGFLSGESMAQTNLIARQGLLQSLAWESMGGFESRVQLYRPNSSGTTTDGFVFFGILSSIGIDASKGAYPTLDLNFEGSGSVEIMHMGGPAGEAGAHYETAAALNASNAGMWFVDSCHPHTSDDVLIWGTENTHVTTHTPQHSLGRVYPVLIAGNSSNYWQDEVQAGIISSGTAGNNTYGVGTYSSGAQGTDTLNSAKLSYDMPTETLTALGGVIEGKTTVVRESSRTFSKPPYKASLALDGQGLLLAGHMKMDESSGQSGLGADELESEIKPHELQIGQLICNIGGSAGGGAAIATRSFSQNVGDVGATYSVTLEGTEAEFTAQHSWKNYGTAGRFA